VVQVDSSIIAAATQAQGAIIVAIIAGVVALATAIFAYLTARQTAKVAAEAAEHNAAISAEASRKTAALTAEVARLTSEEKLKREFQLEYAAERVARELMSDPRWSLRSLALLKIHLGGFDDDELRKILVRAGGIRFESKSGYEIWGLLERNRDLLGVTKIDADPMNRPTMPEWVK
jgi:hypothetical protein